MESAFAEAAIAPSTLPKKRTRDDIILELQKKRATAALDPQDSTNIPSDATFEKAIAVGKFKPIGKSTDEPERRKKKKKRRQEASEATMIETSTPALPLVPAPKASASDAPEGMAPIETDKVPLGEPEDTDIFAEAGEYEGIDLGDEDDPDIPQPKPTIPLPGLSSPKPALHSQRPKAVNWFGESTAESDLLILPVPSKPAPQSTRQQEEEEIEASSNRLVPLASSSIKDIKGFLAIDKQFEKEEARKARKEKNKAKDE